MSHYFFTKENNESLFSIEENCESLLLWEESHQAGGEIVTSFFETTRFYGGGWRGRRRNRQATQIYSCQSKTWGAPTVPRFVDPSHTKKRTVSSRGRPCRDASSQTPVTSVFFIALRLVGKCRITNWRSQLEVEVALTPHPPSRTAAPYDFASRWLKTFSTMCVL